MAIIRGTSKNDRLHGTNGNDTIKGLGGNDSLFGNHGNDKLFGGPGFDKFYFSPGSGRDDIFDFKHGQDKIYISKAFGWTSKAVVLQDAAKGLTRDCRDSRLRTPRRIFFGRLM
jgi:Ca2+-binding RTX toxin-like protein